jgi:hypothetical protein
VVVALVGVELQVLAEERVAQQVQLNLEAREQ